MAVFWLFAVMTVTFFEISSALQCHVCPNDPFGAKGCSFQEATLQQCGPALEDLDSTVSSNSNTIYRCLHTPHRDIFQRAVMKVLSQIQSRATISSSRTGSQTGAQPYSNEYATCMLFLRNIMIDFARPVQRNTRYVFQCDSSDVCRMGSFEKWAYDALLSKPECNQIASKVNVTIPKMIQTGVLCCDFDGCNGLQYWVPKIVGVNNGQITTHRSTITTAPPIMPDNNA